MNYHLTPVSRNGKTGPIPVSTTSARTCPPTCPFNDEGGCYAETGPLALHWRQVTLGTRGTGLDEFCAAIAALPEGQLWRHNQAGDLPGDGVTIDASSLDKLAAANEAKRGFTYTHYDLTDAHNREAVRAANERGFTINASANHVGHADELAEALEGTGIPITVVLPEEAEQVASLRTPAGRKVVVCPATRPGSEVTCATCALCHVRENRAIVGFPVHGTRKRKAEQVARGA